MPDTTIKFSAKYWRERAEEAQVVADQMRDAFARRSMLGVVETYVMLANRAEAREANEPVSEDKK